MEYKLCDNPWSCEEINAINDVVRSGIFTMGDYVKKFETEFEKKFNVKHAIMVNSGSSANLLAIAALVYSGKLPRGSEIIVPAVSWSTTYAPLEQFGMKLIFVDIDLRTLNINLDEVEKAITPNTKMIFCVNLLGNSNDFDRLQDICNKNNIFFIEDNCESLGAKYRGKYLGTLGVIGTYSSFYSHHICTMEGGIAVTDDDILYEYMLAIRAHGWTRNLPEKGSKIYQKKNNAFYESFNFIVPGYNLRPLEMEGAIGCAQLKKLDSMISQRRLNASHFVNKMKSFDCIMIQEETNNSESSWFGFSIILRGKLTGKRDYFVEQLKLNNIEVRPIVAGNYTKNKVIEYMNYSIPFELKNSDYLHENGFFVGNHTKCNCEEVDYFASVISSIIESFEL